MILSTSRGHIGAAVVIPNMAFTFAGSAVQAVAGMRESNGLAPGRCAIKLVHAHNSLTLRAHTGGIHDRSCVLPRGQLGRRGPFSSRWARVPGAPKTGPEGTVRGRRMSIVVRAQYGGDSNDFGRSTTKFPRNLGQSDVGADVRELQELLVAEGFMDNSSVTGCDSPSFSTARAILTHAGI